MGSILILTFGLRVLRSEAWNSGIYSVGALGIKKMKLTLVEFAARWTCLFHTNFQLADLPSNIGTFNFIRD
jgi:hypothetical protein